jgi:hypothetical protein
MTTQQKIPSLGSSDTVITSAIPNLENYLKDGWSIPHNDASQYLTTTQFMETVWNPLKVKYSDNRDFLKHLIEWMKIQKVITNETTFNNSKPLEVGLIYPKSPVERHIHNFHSDTFVAMTHIILNTFLEHEPDMTVGAYFVDHTSNCVIFVNSVTRRPSYDKSKTTEKLYTCILYSKDKGVPIGTVEPPTFYNQDASYICVEEVAQSLHLKKCYLPDGNAINTQFWSFSVKQIISEKNSCIDFTNTLVGSIKDDVRTISSNINTYDEKHTLFVLSNAYAITEESVKTYNIGQYLGTDGLKILKEGNPNNKHLQFWFIENIDRLFDIEITVFDELKIMCGF